MKELSEHCGENLMKMIVEEIDLMSDVYKEDGEIMEFLNDLSKQGHKLIEFNYFKGVSEILDGCNDAIVHNDPTAFDNILNEWDIAYHKSLSVKRKDLFEFFNSLSNHIEELY